MAARRRTKISRKSRYEIDCMRQAGRILAQVLEEVAAAAKPGVATQELDNLVRRRLSEREAEPSFLGYRGYPAALCVEIEEVVVHGIPDERRLAVGEIVGADLGVYYQGFHADSAITVAVGEIDDERRQLIEITRKALAAGIEQARVGNRLRDIAAAVQTVVEAAGLSVVRDLVGHGIGRQVHEPPQVPNFVEEGQFAEYDLILRPGMTLAIEPMVNAGKAAVQVDSDGWTVRTTDGRPSAHFEHTVAIQPGGPEILTRR